MLDVHVIVHSSTPAGVTGEVIALDPAGIERVTVKDKFGLTLIDVTPQCVPMFQTGPFRLPAAKLPVTVSVKVCGNPLPHVEQAWDPGAQAGEPRELCQALRDTPPSAFCINAQGDANQARDLLREYCNVVRFYREAAEVLTGIATACLTAAISLFVAAGAATASFFGAPAAPFLAALGTVFLDLAIAAFAVAAEMWFIMLSHQGRANSARALWDAARDRAGRICCPSHLMLQTDPPPC